MFSLEIINGLNAKAYKDHIYTNSNVNIANFHSTAQAARGDFDFNLPIYNGCRPAERAESRRWLVSKIRRHIDWQLCYTLLAKSGQIVNGRGYHLLLAHDDCACLVETVCN